MEGQIAGRFGNGSTDALSRGAICTETYSRLQQESEAVLGESFKVGRVKQPANSPRESKPVHLRTPGDRSIESFLAPTATRSYNGRSVTTINSGGGALDVGMQPNLKSRTRSETTPRCSILEDRVT